MDKLERIIQRQNEIFSRSNYLSSIGSLSYDSAWNRVLERSDQIQKVLDRYNSRFDALNKSIIPALEQYNSRIFDMTWGLKQMDALAQPFSSMSAALQHMSTGLEHLPAFSALQTRVFEQPDLMSYLHEAIGGQVDTSLLDYYDFLKDSENLEIDNSIVEEILEITESSNVKEKLQLFLQEKGEKGLHVLKTIIVWFAVTFISGWVNYYSEPIYQTLDSCLLFPTENIEVSTNTEEIPSNTEIHLWSDLDNNAIEITFQLDNQEFHGYISKDDLETKSKKISGEVTLDYILFINDVTQLFSKHWELEPETVYSFFNQETDLVNTYILEHYEILKELDGNELIKVVEAHCKENEIAIPKLREE